MKRLSVKLVPYSFAFSVCLLWPFGVALSEPVESNAPVAPNADTDSSRITYDQRQTGKYNIHFSIKDVAIIEVDQNGIEDVAYGDDDYYYDEGYLTVKPLLLNPTTAQSQSTSTSTTPNSVLLNENASTIISPPTTTVSNNQTYSPNLLADIAATHATNSNNNLSTSSNTTTSSTLTPMSIPRKRTQNVVILDTQSLTHNSPTSTHKPAMSTTPQTEETNARSKDVPVKSIFPEDIEQAYHSTNSPKLSTYPHLRFADAYPDETTSNSQQKEQENDSRIFKFKARRAHQQTQPVMKTSAAAVAYPAPHFHTISSRRCRAHQYRDASGACRAKRSSSLLKKLFSMLVTLPFPNERANDDRDDE